MHTTITVNGADGIRFLSSLTYQGQMPRALEWLLQSDDPSIEVAREDAEQVADFMEHVLGSDWQGRPPLLFSPRIGDEVVLARDALLEIQLPRRSSRTWRFIAAGTRGRLVALHDGIGRVVLVDGPEAHKVTFVGEATMTRAPRHTDRMSRR